MELRISALIFFSTSYSAISLFREVALLSLSILSTPYTPSSDWRLSWRLVSKFDKYLAFVYSLCNWISSVLSGLCSGSYPSSCRLSSRKLKPADSYSLPSGLGVWFEIFPSCSLVLQIIVWASFSICMWLFIFFWLDLACESEVSYMICSITETQFPSTFFALEIKYWLSL